MVSHGDMSTAALELHTVLSWVCYNYPPCGTPEEMESAPLLSTFWVFGVRGRTEILSGLSLSLWLGTRLVLSDFWMGARKEGGNGDLVAPS